MLIWLRRFIALLLLVVFVLFFFATLLAFRINDTLLEASFYKGQLRQADMYNFLFGDLLPIAVDENIDEFSDLPFGVALTSERIVSSVQRVVPPEWVQAQVEQVIDEVVPYATGETDSFTITVLLKDRVEAALEVINEILRDADTYNFVFDDVISPIVEESVGQRVELPYGIVLTADEIVAALREVLPLEWVQERVDHLIDEVGPYLTGEADSFAITVPLEDRVHVAVPVAIDLLEPKLRHSVDALPTCTLEQLLSVDLEAVLRDLGNGQLPPCKPPGFQYVLVQPVMDLVIQQRVQQVLDDNLAVQFTYTEADLRQALTQSGNEDAVDLLDNVREVVSQGWTYTDADFRQDLVEGEGDVRVKDVDRAREWLGRARANLFAGYIVLGVLLLIVGLLGGRGLWGKLRWAAVALILGTAVTLAVAAVVQDRTATVVQDGVDTFVAGLELGTQVSEAVTDKIVEVVSNVSEEFWGRIESQARIYLVVGAVVLVGSILGNLLFRRRRRAS